MVAGGGGGGGGEGLVGIGTLSVVGVGDGWRIVLDSFCSCCLIWSTSETSWRQWRQSALGTDCCG